MAKVVRVHCNGLDQHINEVDLDHALEETVAYRSSGVLRPTLPERVSLRCEQAKCEGRVVLTRGMFMEMLGADNA